MDLIEWALFLFESLLALLSFLGVGSLVSSINEVFARKGNEVLKKDNVKSLIHYTLLEMTRSFYETFHEFFQAAGIKRNALHQYAFGNDPGGVRPFQETRHDRRRMIARR